MSPHAHIFTLKISVLCSNWCWAFVVVNLRRVLFLRRGGWTGDGVQSTLSRHLFVPLLDLELRLGPLICKNNAIKKLQQKHVMCQQWCRSSNKCYCTNIWSLHIALVHVLKSLVYSCKTSKTNHAKGVNKQYSFTSATVAIPTQLHTASTEKSPFKGILHSMAAKPKKKKNWSNPKMTSSPKSRLLVGTAGSGLLRTGYL